MSETPKDNKYEFKKMDAGILEGLTERTKQDAGAPFEADVLEALKAVRVSDPVKWHRIRSELKALRVQMTELDRLTKPAAKDAGPANKVNVEFVAPWYEPVSGAEIAHIIRGTLGQHIKFQDDEEADAVTLWIMGSWLMDRWALFPKCLITSPEKRCGKSTLLEAIEAFAFKPIYAAQVSPASLFRMIEAVKPTVMMDEADQTLKNNDDLIGLINAGHRKRQANVIRVQEVNGGFIPVMFSVWSPQVIAGIGRIKDTLEDRSIRIELRRRLPAEYVEKMPADLFERHSVTRQKIARWASDFPQAHIEADAMPENLGNDRAQDNWEPLCKVALNIGGEWPERTDRAYRLIEQRHADDDLPIPVQLVCDIWSLFEPRPYTKHIPTSSIVEDLNAMEDRPWREINHGRALTQSTMMRRLSKFGIKSIAMTPENGGGKLKCIRRRDVEESFDRYGNPKYDLPDPPKKRDPYDPF